MPRLRITQVVSTDAQSVFAIERLEQLAGNELGGVFVSASIRPIAVIVRDASELRAYDIEANSVDLGQLCEDNPGLDVLLDACITRHAR